MFADDITFHFSGTIGKNITNAYQLRLFDNLIAESGSDEKQASSNWADAFAKLRRLVTVSTRERQVIFLDELPWLASPRSGFLSALDHFWNSYGSRRQGLIVVICGSAASWMIVNVLYHKGGLHNRVTRTLALQPFNLAETEMFLQGRGIALDRDQILEIYMAVGGIPYYLYYLRKGSSAAQNIDALFFGPNPPLRDEFSRLFSSLFDNHERHLKVIETLSKRRSGLTRQEIGKATKLTTGGSLTTVLSELETTGFILRVVPFGKAQRDALYRLIDAFTLFYLRWFPSSAASRDGGPWWLHQRDTSAGAEWSGYAFENVCLCHVRQLKQALGISGILTEQSAWYHRAADSTDSGAQIDLVIDRPDNVLNLCEMKYSDDPWIIDKRYAGVLRNRAQIFRNVTGTRKSLFNTFVTVRGVAPGMYKSELVANDIRADALFADVPNHGR